MHEIDHLFLTLDIQTQWATCTPEFTHTHIYIYTYALPLNYIDQLKNGQGELKHFPRTIDRGQVLRRGLLRKLEKKRRRVDICRTHLTSASLLEKAEPHA